MTALNLTAARLPVHDPSLVLICDEHGPTVATPDGWCCDAIAVGPYPHHSTDVGAPCFDTFEELLRWEIGLAEVLG